MNRKGKILVVDDSENTLFVLNVLLAPCAEKIRVGIIPEQIDYYIEDFRPDVILLDMNFSKVSANNDDFFWLNKILRIDPQAVVLMVCAESGVEKAMRAIAAGATGFVLKPWEKYKLQAAVFSALRLRKAYEQTENFGSQLRTHYSADILSIGESAAMQKLRSKLEEISTGEANVLITGENGTEKKLVAHEIFRSSPRSQQIMGTIDFSILPEKLFDNELFGYKRFDDADRVTKTGQLEIAEGGTLIMSDIDNLSPRLQTKLLSAIDEKQISEINTYYDNIRFISTAGSNIREKFNSELLNLLGTVKIHVPPLRERADDLIPLAEYFMKKFARRYRKDSKLFSQDAILKLQNYSWTGNVSELENVIERAVLLSSGKIMKGANIVIQTGERNRNNNSLNLNDIEREYINKAMKRSHGNINQAAALLGISRYSMYRRLKEIENEETLSKKK